MHITADHAVALAIVALAWIGRIVSPQPAANIAGWVLGVLITIVLLLGAIGH